ncbi:MAG: tetratricopeptide repeat protein [Dysgonamonadaceae bacterium]|jgi:tetratricopeptide (TPR) repeat protein|nr:tetratricopeptide repeat protein [Dysgonamonadaceae bacterium]
MKHLFIVIGLLACFSSGSKEKISMSDSISDQRKFDYFFLEALKLKENGDHNAAYNALLYSLEIDSTSSAALFELSNYYLYMRKNGLALDALKKAVDYGNNNFEYKIALANLYRDLKQNKESVTIYEELVEKYPSKPELNYYLSDLYVRQSEIEKGIHALDVLEENMGMNQMLSMRKFQLYVMIEQKDKAFFEVEKLALKYPNEARYEIMLGDLYLEQNSPDTALVHYGKAHKIDPENPYYIVSMANYYEYKGDNEAALNEVDVALRNSKLDVETKLGILGRYIQVLQQGKKDVNSAIGLFETLLEQHPQEKELNLMYGQFLQMRNKPEEAKFQFQVVTESEPDNINAWKLLMGIYLRLEDMDGCIKVCDDALTRFPDDPEFYFYKGAAYYQKKEYQKALDTYNKGVSTVPEKDPALKSDFYGQMGDLYYHLKQKDKAYEMYDMALQFNDRNIVVLNNYAYFLSLDKKDLSKAERMSNQCIKLQPDNSTYIDTYAWVLFVQGSYSLAKFYIELALSKDTEKSAEIIEHYGDILFMNGEQDKAHEEWKKALQMKENAGEDTTVLKKKVADKKYYENDPE